MTADISANTIFASNTSSLAISEIAENCTEERQANFGGLHFFNRASVVWRR